MALHFILYLNMTQIVSDRKEPRILSALVFPKNINVTHLYLCPFGRLRIDSCRYSFHRHPFQKTSHFWMHQLYNVLISKCSYTFYNNFKYCKHIFICTTPRTISQPSQYIANKQKISVQICVPNRLIYVSL